VKLLNSPNNVNIPHPRSRQESDNRKLADFVPNENLKEKLCKLQTSEEVLELLKKYNYHESKEVFEVGSCPRRNDS